MAAGIYDKPSEHPAWQRLRHLRWFWVSRLAYAPKAVPLRDNLIRLLMAKSAKQADALLRLLRFKHRLQLWLALNHGVGIEKSPIDTLRTGPRLFQKVAPKPISKHQSDSQRSALLPWGLINVRPI
ncbi:MAG: hypothetical protein CVU16_13090 [Betaproteobacteria bacterium HGW-Betaproteobacteria-10]|nr:MAG: hypothetical protein CVU16_13090 [Betaproteobacteria bacterium HGW-Betaproteobacteria-10]